MASLRKAINAKCKECIYDPYEKGSWRQQAKGCTSTMCPLYPVRPTPIVENPPKKAKKNALKDHIPCRSFPGHELSVLSQELGGNLGKFGGHES